MSRKLYLAKCVSKENVLGFSTAFFVVASLSLVARQFHIEAPGAEQSLSFSAPLTELGTVLQSETIRRDLRLVNHSDVKLRIVGAGTSCACTMVPERILGKIIQPHSSLLVPVEYHSGLVNGSKSAEIRVFAEDDLGKTNSAGARLHGTVLAEFTIEPQSVDFGTVKPGETASRNVFFQPAACRNLRILKGRSNNSNFDILVRDGKGDSSGEPVLAVVITLHVPLAAHRQPLSGQMRFETSSHRVPVAVVPVRAMVSPDVDVSPKILVFGSDDASGLTTLTIHTVKPSRIFRVVTSASETSDDIRTVNYRSAELTGWQTEHVCTLENRALAQAKRITVELEVHKDAERTEALSTSVEIKRL